MDHSRARANRPAGGFRLLGCETATRAFWPGLVAALLASCSQGGPSLEARFESPGILAVTNRTGATLEYSGHLLGGLHLAHGDFNVSVRNAKGDRLAPCGVFDPFTPAQRRALADGQTARFSMLEGQPGSLYCMSEGERGFVVVEYSATVADRTKVLFHSAPVAFEASNSGPGVSNPYLQR